MTDREKVIKGLEKFIADFEPFCGNKADWQRVYDALGLLKAQEPRVLTLEEVKEHYSLPPVFPDDFSMQEDYYEDIIPLYFDFPDSDAWVIHWRGAHYVRPYLEEWGDGYGKRWRVWTAKPTQEQREATPWE